MRRRAKRITRDCLVVFLALGDSGLRAPGENEIFPWKSSTTRRRQEPKMANFLTINSVRAKWLWMI